MKINKLNTSFKDPVISSLDQLDQIKLPDTNKADNNINQDDINLDYKYVNLDTAKKEVVWLLGAYIRSGSRTSSTSFRIPHSLHNPTLHPTQPRGTRYTLLNLLELGFSKDLSPGPGIQWVEEKGLVHEFLKGFALISGNKENYYTTKSDIHIPLIFKWLNRHGFDPILHSPTFISWTPNFPLHPIPATLEPGKYWIGKKLKKTLNPDNDPEIEEKLNRMKYLIIKEEEL